MTQVRKHDEERLNSLLRWTGELSGAPFHVGQLSSVLLQHSKSGDESFQRKSFLNNDGSPLQVCVTYGSSGRKVRLIGDPAAHINDPNLRFGYARQALTELLVLTGANQLAETCEETLQQMLPISRNTEMLQAGTLWLAAGIEGGSAVYVNTRWGNAKERWRDAVGWLQALLPCSQDAEALIRAVSPYSVVVSVALEGATAMDARVKLYWRLEYPTSIHQMGVQLLTHSAFHDFLIRSVSDKSLSLSGMVFSASFGLSDGALRDVKIDLCAHCLPRPPAEWIQILQDCCHAFHLAPLDVAEGLLQRQCELAFVGFGIDSFEKQRLNLYLKTPQSRH